MPVFLLSVFASLFPDLVHCLELLDDQRHPAKGFQAVACLSGPIGSRLFGLGNILGLGLKPKVFKIDEHERSLTGTQEVEAPLQ